MIVLGEGSEHGVVVHILRPEQLGEIHLVRITIHPSPQSLHRATRIVGFTLKDAIGNAKEGVLGMHFIRL